MPPLRASHCDNFELPVYWGGVHAMMGRPSSGGLWYSRRYLEGEVRIGALGVFYFTSCVMTVHNIYFCLQ